ncbi:hypothetical protein DFH06DRAFT_1483667 [Mycena polygramma]|nr:hypothetical protein DFH06DRAFT_1483667 [Mycena polygramma]
MPSKSKATKCDDFVRKAIQTCINQITYAPTLPFVPEGDWPACFDASANGPGSDPKSVLEREVYHQMGSSTLAQAIFLMSVDDLDDKPVGYSQAIQEAVRAREILKAVMQKIDKNLLDGGITRVDVGFHEHVGVVWTLAGRNTERVMRRLSPIFLPLLRAAGDAYLSFNASKQSSKRNTTEKSVDPGTADDDRVKRVPGDLQFIVNARAVQAASAGPSPLSPLSPGAFDLDSPLASRSDILSADIHNFDGQHLDLARAGATTVKNRGAVLQATQLLEKLLAAGDTTPCTPVTLSLAVDDLMHKLLELSPHGMPRWEKRGRPDFKMPIFAGFNGSLEAETRSSSLPGVLRTPERNLLAPGFEYDAGEAHTATPKSKKAGPSRSARRPLTPNNQHASRHGGVDGSVDGRGC